VEEKYPEIRMKEREAGKVGKGERAQKTMLIKNSRIGREKRQNEIR
jgi:hypothetical protein